MLFEARLDAKSVPGTADCSRTLADLADLGFHVAAETRAGLCVAAERSPFARDVVRIFAARDPRRRRPACAASLEATLLLEDLPAAGFPGQLPGCAGDDACPSCAPGSRCLVFLAEDACVCGP